VTRADLTEQVYQAIEMPRKESDVVVCAIFDGIVVPLDPETKLRFVDSEPSTRASDERVGRNPKTGARVDVPAKRIPFFKPSKQLRELVERF
jgi:integration host factor subunit beta